MRIVMMKIYKNIIKIISIHIYMENSNQFQTLVVYGLIGMIILYVLFNMNDNSTQSTLLKGSDNFESTVVFVLIGIIVLYLIVNMNQTKPKTAAVTTTSVTTSNSNEEFKNKENFEPNQSSDMNLAQNTVQAVEFVDPNQLNVAVPDGIAEQNRQMDLETGEVTDDGVLNVQGTDLLLAAAADRFYSIDIKGQSNRNASYDIRGEEAIPYNDNYTPFNASHIVGAPKITTGRL